MTMESPLYRGKLLHFAAPDPDRDAEVEAAWSHDAEFHQLIAADPFHPQAAFSIKKRYDEYSKETMRYRFCIRTNQDDRTVGFIDLFDIAWTNRVSSLSLGIGKPQDRSHGYGREALRMMLRIAFDELNLYRVSAATFEYNRNGIDFLQKNGFEIEVRMREAVHRFNRYWDSLILGIRKEDWQARQHAWEAE